MARGGEGLEPVWRPAPRTFNNLFACAWIATLVQSFEGCQLYLWHGARWSVRDCVSCEVDRSFFLLYYALCEVQYSMCAEIVSGRGYSIEFQMLSPPAARRRSERTWL